MGFFLRSFAAFILCISASAAESPKLFKSYAYDAPLSQFPVGEQFYDCTADHGVTARCSDAESFLGHSFEMILKFHNEGLASVTLATLFDQQIYLKAIGALHRDFGLIMLQGKTDRLDIIDLIRQSRGKAAYEPRINEYESLNLSQGQLTYTFIEQPKEAYRNHKTAIAAVMNAPGTARVVEMMAMEDEENAILGLVFSLPRLDKEKLERTIKDAPKESF